MHTHDAKKSNDDKSSTECASNINPWLEPLVLLMPGGVLRHRLVVSAEDGSPRQLLSVIKAIVIQGDICHLFHGVHLFVKWTQSLPS